MTAMTTTTLTPEWVLAHADEVPPEEDGATVTPNAFGGYDGGSARIADDDGELIVYRFDGRRERKDGSWYFGPLLWSARFDPTCPVEVVAAAWQAARA